MKNAAQKLLVSVALCGSMLFAQESERAIVTVAALKIRSEPAATAPVVTVAKKGTIVKILAKTNAEVTIDSITDYWYRVESDGKTGWLFGGYTDTGFKVVGGNSNLLLWQVRTGGENRNLVAFDVLAQKERRFAALSEIVGCEFSEDLKYLACDSGTDKIGSLAVFDFQTTRKIFEGPYEPREPTWRANMLRFDHVLCVDDGFTLKEEKVIEAGKLKKTGKYRRGDYHVGVTSGDCARYKKLVK